MENLEEKVFMEHDQAPRVWRRFVDDILAVVKRNHGYKWLSKLNAARENITFTTEEETERTLPSMDVKFSRSENRELKEQCIKNQHIQTDLFSSITSTKQSEVGGSGMFVKTGDNGE